VFPCQRQPTVRYGITEPVEYGVGYRLDPSGWGLWDNTWRVFRGGLFAPVTRTSSVTELATTFRDWPDVRDVQVFRFHLPYRTGGYELAPGRDARMGWAGPPVG
jgi:arabinosyltransferase C